MHEHRYFSAGRPTKLVRDGGTEDYDPPPPGPPMAELIKARDAQTTNVGELRRADDSTSGVVYDAYLAALRGDLIQIRLSRGHRQR